MQDKIGFLRRRHASLFRAVENLQHNRDAIEGFVVEFGQFEDIFDRTEEALSKVKAIRTAIEDKISELEAAS
jgi:hypothetical protein